MDFLRDVLETIAQLFFLSGAIVWTLITAAKQPELLEQAGAVGTTGAIFLFVVWFVLLAASFLIGRYQARKEVVSEAA